MSSSRIEQIIEEIEEFIEGCRYQPLSTTKIVVNKEELEELLRELRLKTPDEIKRYQKIISNKDAILADAQEKSDAIIAEAKAKADEMVTQTEIMKQAYVQASDTINDANLEAQGILDSAQQDANNIRVSAISYTNDILSNMLSVIGNSLADITEKNNALIGSMQNYYDVLNQNLRELSPVMDDAGSANDDGDDDFNINIDPQIELDDGDDE